MAVITGSNAGFGLSGNLSFLALYYSIVSGTPTSSAWSSVGTAGTYLNARWEIRGDNFGNIQNGYPTTGTITSITYLQAGTVQMSVSGLSLDVARFRQLQTAGDYPSYLEFAAFLFASDDTFTGGAGDDSFDGYAGNDVLSGGAGSDVFTGGSGNDQIFGGDGADHLSDGDLFDTTTSGNDIFNGGAGNDKIFSTSGNNSLLGGDGDDYLSSSGLNVDIIDGGAGYDRALINRANSTAAFTIDLSNIATTSEMQLVDGTIIRNVEIVSDITTGSGNDVLRLGIANMPPLLAIGPGLWPTTISSNFNLGGGTNRVIADFSTADFNIELGNSGIQRSYLPTFTSGSIRLSTEEIELHTGSGADVLHGREYSYCLLDGGSGDDVITGGSGADRLIGGAGNDTINIQYGGADIVDGGAGFDTLTTSFEFSPFGVTLAPMALASVSGWTAYGGATINNFERVDVRLSDFNDTATLSNLSLVSGSQIINGANGTDTIVADFTAMSADVTMGYEGYYDPDGFIRAGDAEVLLRNFERFEIVSGAGNDDLKGTAWNDSINGGLGNDRISGGGGIDQLYGGGGDDIVTATSDGFVNGSLIDGGAGKDSVNFTVSQSNNGFNFKTSQLASDTGVTIGGGILKNIETFAIYANASTGSITIDRPLVGRNYFESQMQFSVLFVDASTAITKVSLGENGNLFSVAGQNGDLQYLNVVLSVQSGSANDVLIGADGGDYLRSGAGNDLLEGGAGSDVLDAGAGNDLLDGGSGGDVLNGGTGNDTANYDQAGSGIYVFIGDGGSWTGDAAGDTFTSIENLTGSGFNDILGMDGGNNVIDGGAGDDVLFGQGGGDTLIGGAGFDTASYATATSGIYAFIGDWGSFTGDARGDVYNSIEAIIGTNFNDIIGMDDNANRLVGGGGNDVLYGEGGGDQLFGNDGFDTVSYALAPSGVYVFLTDLGNATGDAAGDSFFSSIESIVGSNFDDIIGMGNFNDMLVGGGGNDVLHGLGGGDRFFGNDGFDTVSYALAGSGVYVFLADLGNATGDAAGDQDFSSIESIVGSNFNDIIGMGNFADTIIAGSGNDILFGMGGNDNLWGGAGNDLFAYNGTGFGADTIRDFQDGLDRIDFSRMAGVNYASLAITSVTGGTQVALGTSTILLSGISIGQVSAARLLVCLKSVSYVGKPITSRCTSTFDFSVLGFIFCFGYRPSRLHQDAHYSLL